MVIQYLFQSELIVFYRFKKLNLNIFLLIHINGMLKVISTLQYYLIIVAEDNKFALLNLIPLKRVDIYNILI